MRSCTSPGATAGVEFCHVPFDLVELEKVALDSGRPYADREAAMYRSRA